jgi:hypothetical protein
VVTATLGLPSRPSEILAAERRFCRTSRLISAAVVSVTARQGVVPSAATRSFSAMPP